MGESDAKTFTHTWTPEPKPPDQHQIDLDAEIRGRQEMELLTVRAFGPSVGRRRVAAAAPQRKRNAAVTPEEKRMKKIRGLLAKMSGRPDPKTYCHWMDQAQIALPELCRGIPGGPKNYRDAYETPRFAAAIRSELSRAWSGLSSES